MNNINRKFGRSFDGKTITYFKGYIETDDGIILNPSEEQIINLAHQFYVIDEMPQKEGYYYQIDEDGNVRYDLEPTTENTGVPFYVWSGQWQEGIFISVASIFSSASPSDWKNNFLQRWYNEDQMQRNAFRSSKRLEWS